MKGIVVTNLILVCAINIYSQLINDTVYFDSSWEQINPENAKYYRIISNDTTGKIQFSVRDYYISGSIQMTGNFKSINPDYRLGIFYYYYENGKTKVVCNYLNNKLDGDYFEFYNNGQLKSSKNYRNGLLEGVQKSWSIEGIVTKKVEYKNGEKNGKFSTYYKNGQLIRRDVYKNNELIKGKCFTHEGRDTSYFRYFIMPKFKGGLEGFKKYILNNIIYPEIAVKNNEEGQVLIKFTIDKAGNLVKPKIVKKDKEYFNEEAIRVINTSPKWIPGKRDGKLVDVSITIPLKFRLN